MKGEAEPVVTLKACPFCGGEALVLPAHPLPKMWAVACKQCDAKPAGAFTYADAANRWNTCHRGAAVAEAVAAVDEAGDFCSRCGDGVYRCSSCGHEGRARTNTGEQSND